MSSQDKVDEYFEIKNKIKTLRKDLNDFTKNQPQYSEIQNLVKKVKKLREEIREIEEYQNIKSKIDELRERQELLKELIRIELIDSHEDEVTKNGIKLKLVPVLKEMPDKD